jgi:uncharacterized protein YceK
MRSLKDLDAGGFGMKTNGIKDMAYRQLALMIAMTLSISGCVSLAASTAGTFIGNIASDRFLKEVDKNGKDKNAVQTNMRAGCKTKYMQDVQKNRGRNSKLVRLHTRRTQSCNEAHQG